MTKSYFTALGSANLVICYIYKIIEHIMVSFHFTFYVHVCHSSFIMVNKTHILHKIKSKLFLGFQANDGFWVVTPCNLVYVVTSIVKLGAAYSFYMLLSTYKTVGCHKPKDRDRALFTLLLQKTGTLHNLQYTSL